MVTASSVLEFLGKLVPGYDYRAKRSRLNTDRSVREKLVRVSFQETKPVEGQYPPDVVEMVPDIAHLKPEARKSLQRRLKKPNAFANLLTAIDEQQDEKKE